MTPMPPRWSDSEALEQARTLLASVEEARAVLAQHDQARRRARRIACRRMVRSLAEAAAFGIVVGGLVVAVLAGLK